jgi:hypothetical protein
MAKLGLKSNKISAWTVAGIIGAAAGIALVAGYAVHKLRMRHVMQNEIRDIMCVAPPLPLPSIVSAFFADPLAPTICCQGVYHRAIWMLGNISSARGDYLCPRTLSFNASSEVPCTFSGAASKARVVLLCCNLVMVHRSRDGNSSVGVAFSVLCIPFPFYSMQQVERPVRCRHFLLLMLPYPACDGSAAMSLAGFLHYLRFCISMST